jgi:heme exporter protein D
MSGMIVGGMEFVWAAYGISAFAFVAYTISVIARFRRAAKEVDAAGEQR